MAPPLETEYKFLVEHLPPGAEDGLDFEPIRQGYLAAGPPTVRVRRRGSRACLTLKGRPAEAIAGQALTRQEFEYPIPVEDAEALLALGCPQVRKRRAVLASGIELDLFEGPLSGLVLAEMECAPGDPPPDPPPGWKWRDVSTDPRWSNHALAVDGLPGDAVLARG